MMNVHAQTWMICQQKPFGDFSNVTPFDSIDHIIA